MLTLGNSRLKCSSPPGRGKLSVREEANLIKKQKIRLAFFLRRAGFKYVIQNKNSLNQEISARKSKFSHEDCCDFWKSLVFFPSCLIDESPLPFPHVADGPALLLSEVWLVHCPILL